MGTTTVTIAAYIPVKLHEAFDRHLREFTQSNPACKLGTDRKGRIEATLPDELCGPYLQHFRDFDTAHPDCHFEIVMKAPDMSLQTIDALYGSIDPPFKYRKTFSKH